MLAQLRQRHLVQHPAGDLDAGLAHEVVAEQPDAKALRRSQHVDQRDIAEEIGKIERVQIAPRRKAPPAALGLPVIEQPQQRRRRDLLVDEGHVPPQTATVATCPAVAPAMRPKTAPEISPVPPG